MWRTFSEMDMKPLGVMLLLDVAQSPLQTSPLHDYLNLGVAGIVLYIYLMEKKERQERQKQEDARYAELEQRSDKRYQELLDRLFKFMGEKKKATAAGEEN